MVVPSASSPSDQPILSGQLRRSLPVDLAFGDIRLTAEGFKPGQESSVICPGVFLQSPIDELGHRRVSILGIMGHSLAANILKAGFPLTVWNRTRKKTAALSAAGAPVEPQAPG